MKLIQIVVRASQSGKYAVGVLAALLVLISPNAFAVWTKAFTPAGKVDIIVEGSGASSATMYAVQNLATGNASLYKSSDAGVTWTPVTMGTNIVKTISSIAINPNNANNVFVVGLDGATNRYTLFTTDNGLTWTPSTVLNTSGSSQYVDLRGVAVSASRVYVYDSTMLYSKGISSTDINWIPGSLTTTDTIKQVLVSSTLGSVTDTVLVATYSGLYLSSNGISSLTPLNTFGTVLPTFGLTSQTFLMDIVADPSNAANVYLAFASVSNPAASGLFRGTLSGQTATWTNVTGSVGSLIYTALTTQSGIIRKVTVDATSVYVNISSRPVGQLVSREQVFANSDKFNLAGASWLQVSGTGQDVGVNGIYETNVYDMAVGSSTLGANIVVAGETGIHSSTVTGTAQPCTTPGGCVGTTTGVDMAVQFPTFTPAQVTIGGFTSLAVTVRNNSTTLTASGVVVDITMPSFPAGLVFPATTAVTSTPFGVYTCTGQATAALRCSRALGTVFPANGTETLTVPFQVPATVTTGTTLSLTVRVSHTPVSAADADTNQVNNSSQATLTVGTGSGITPLPGQNVAPVASNPSLQVSLTSTLPVTGTLGVTDANNDVLTYTVTPAISPYGSTFTVNNGFYSYTRGPTAGVLSESFSVNVRDTAGLSAIVNITFLPGQGFVDPAAAGGGGGGALHPLMLLVIATMAGILRRRVTKS